MTFIDGTVNVWIYQSTDKMAPRLQGLAMTVAINVDILLSVIYLPTYFLSLSLYLSSCPSPSLSLFLHPSLSFPLSPPLYSSVSQCVCDVGGCVGVGAGGAPAAVCACVRGSSLLRPAVSGAHPEHHEAPHRLAWLEHTLTAARAGHTLSLPEIP